MEGRDCVSKGLIGGGSGSWRDCGLGPATGQAEYLRPPPGRIHLCVHDATKLQAGPARESHHKVWEPVTVEAIGLGPDTKETGRSYWRDPSTGPAIRKSHL